MSERRRGRRAVLGSIAASLLAGCSRLRGGGPLGGSDPSAPGLEGEVERRRDGTETATGTETRSLGQRAFDVVARFAAAYNTDDYEALQATLSRGSPVKERVGPELLARYDLPTITPQGVARAGSSVVVQVRLELRDRDGSTSEFTTRFQLVMESGRFQVYEIDDPAPMLRAPGTPTATPEAEETTAVDDDGTYGFEGDLAAWTVEREEWGQRDDVAYAGTYSGGITAGGPDTGDYIGTLATATPERLAGGQQPTRVDHYWYERAASFGGGLRLVNSDGEVELSVGTDNPTWFVEDGDGTTELYDGDGYDRWVRTTVALDWEAGTASVTFTDQQSGTAETTDATLAVGTDIEVIRLAGFTMEQGWRAESCHMFWDDVEVER
ncbi:hypothetical protein [Haloglomus halophilum]|uniref:hypothetical protein n=1 Tax=Haloglomus halophilum TaxID=2962672 RepID=UPI0020CA1DFE|nr:hypothetical protein [Haloglomus halophilum]